VITNSLDIDRLPFRPQALHRPLTVGWLGQVAPQTGHDDAVEAMRRVGGNVRLLVAGKGEISYEKKLERRAAGLPVEFIGFVSLADFFQKTDVLIVPSWEEPFGIVLLEAMASGIPVIATNRGGLIDIISSPLEGVLVPPRDPCAL